MSVRTLTLSLAFTLIACTSAQNLPANEDDPHKREPPRACTEMACSDQAQIDTKLSAAGAGLGTHEFALEVDDAAQTCTVEFTTPTEITYASCSGAGASLLFGPVMRGKDVTMTVESQSVVMHSEEPVPGEFHWQLTLAGTPAKVHVRHTHAGQPVVDQTAAITYTNAWPNGEGCEPVCKAGSAAWQGP